jgi:hypothetical protein
MDRLIGACRKLHRSAFLMLFGVGLALPLQIFGAQPLAITIQPVSQTNVVIGSTVVFTAGVEGERDPFDFNGF